MKKRFLLYIDMMERGGAQRVFVNLIQHLTDAQVDVVLVNDFELASDVAQYSVDERVRRYYLRKSLKGNPILKNIERVTQLRCIVKKEKPDIVLSFLGRPNKRMLLATFGLKTKKIISVRNDPNCEYAAGGFSKWFARNLFRLADGCVFQTEEAAKYFPLAVQKKSTVILNPVDLKFFNTVRTEEPHNIVTVGRLESQKNQGMLIKAFAEIAREFPGEKLIIYGEGSLREELENLCESLHIADRVEMPGNILNVEKALSEAKVFVLPSNYEGLPNALMEAMAVGLPCISTDCPCGGPKLLISDARNGMLVPVGNEKQMADMLRSLLLDTNKLEMLGMNAKKRAEDFKTDVILFQWDNYLFGYC